MMAKVAVEMFPSILKNSRESLARVKLYNYCMFLVREEEGREDLDVFEFATSIVLLLSSFDLSQAA